MDKNLHLSPPWIDYANELVSLFGDDPDIKLDYKEDEKILTFFVDNTDKANALTKLLPAEKNFGGTIFYTKIVPADRSEEPTDAELIKLAFKGNRAVANIVDAELFEHPVTYVAFQKKIVQYFNDDLSDLHGNKTTLLQEIAKSVFPDKTNVFFCTDNAGGIGKPLGEWP